ncbi:MAG: nucleoside hydrolase [Succiniclasticum sp.]|jgi:inosine-uridine nucleoside N-ribohydrolase|uniref:Inosine-uridine nucleoside N-ribohydrolase n=1 Tax=Succiniclasticum ruminis TaxID=40841 RepID=A0A1G6KDX9_9FIRM|nr:nucleoside hydrolase [Succiniclasticum ruminis]MEE3396477.1 nucleoside hydrolase [Succiniclasticum sp.]MEE3454831.1 nucleoside hydrolase [Succiniclasticum sp.]SDC29289.1 Inosine-uridine nucleoside N-ribohydrolase [Succiniclasticum ruminis]
MKTWKRLLQTTCVAALVGATAMTVTASAAKAPLAKAPEKIPVILDADMVDLFDDGVALLILAQSPKVDLKGVTVVIGNSWVEDGVASTIRHLEGIGRTDIPVFAGNNKPTRPGRIENIKAEKKLWGRGHDSHLGAAGYPKPASWQETYRERYKSEPTIGPKAEDASDFIIRTIKENPHKVTIVGIGTGGNIAKALEKDPSIAPLAKEIVYMAGAFLHAGNVMPTAEFNVWLDPESAKKEYRGAWPKQTFFPLDVCENERINYKNFLDLEKRVKNPVFKHMWENHYQTPLFRNNQKFENYIWDVLAASYVLDPSIVTEEVFMPVDVNDTYSLSYGETLAFAGPGPEGSQKAHIVQKIDRKKVWKIVTDTFDKL